MSRRKLIQIYQPDPEGPQYGRVVKSGDIMDIQAYLNRRLDLILRDLVVRTAAAAQVEGFAHSLPGGMTFRVASGQATDLAGRSYENYPLDANTDLVIGPAPPANSRIDLVYASLVADQDSEPQLLPHRRLRTPLEYEQDAAEYDPANYNVNTERRNSAVLSVRAGVAAVNPVAPAVGANEVALYQVRVDAGDVAVAAGKVTDVRGRLRSLYQLMQNVIALETNPIITDFTEKVQDALTSFFPDASPFDWTVDDPNNRVMLDIAVATAALKGLMSAADKSKLDAATAALTANAIVQRDANGDAALRALSLRKDDAGARPVLLKLSNLALGGGTGSAIEFEEGAALPGARIAQDFNTGGGNNHSLIFSLAQTPGAGLADVFVLDWSEPRARVNGNFSATGSVSAAAKPFIIDHPAPGLAREKFLRYNAPEMPEVAVIVRGTATLTDGRVVVDLDAVARQSPGTFEHLTRNVQVVPWNESEEGSQWEWEPVRGRVEGGKLTLRTRDPQASFRAGFLVVAERKDQYILNSDLTDNDGHLIVEFDKPEIAPERVAELLSERLETVEADDDAEERERVEQVNELAGSKGHLLHPEAFGETHPIRRVKIRTVIREKEKGKDKKPSRK